MPSRELGVLFRKEWRQLTRSRGAVGTALFLPAVLMIGVPLMMTLNVPGRPPPISLTGPLARLSDPKQLLAVFLPAFIGMAGLIVPSVSATYTLISERESRTLELLVALPVRISQILAAKLLAIVCLASLVTLPLYLFDIFWVLGRTSMGWGPRLLLLPVLVSAIAMSTASALLIGLLARDFRTANNVNGALLAPLLVVSMPVTIFSPSTAFACVALTVFYALGAVVCAAVAIKGVTFERLLR